MEKVGDSTYVYIFISGELEKFDYVKNIKVFNITSVKDVHETRLELKEKYNGDDVEVWKLDYRSKIL